MLNNYSFPVKAAETYRYDKHLMNQYKLKSCCVSQSPFGFVYNTNTEVVGYVFFCPFPLISVFLSLTSIDSYLNQECPNRTERFFPWIIIKPESEKTEEFLSMCKVPSRVLTTSPDGMDEHLPIMPDHKEFSEATLFIISNMI